MSVASRLVIAVVVGVVAATLTFFIAFLAYTWLLGNCAFFVRPGQEALCSLVNISSYGCCFFPIVGVIAFAITYFVLPKQ